MAADKGSDSLSWEESNQGVSKIAPSANRERILKLKAAMVC